MSKLLDKIYPKLTGYKMGKKGEKICRKGKCGGVGRWLDKNGNPGKISLNSRGFPGIHFSLVS